MLRRFRNRRIQKEVERVLSQATRWEVDVHFDVDKDILTLEFTADDPREAITEIVWDIESECHVAVEVLGWEFVDDFRWEVPIAVFPL